MTAEDNSEFAMRMRAKREGLTLEELKHREHEEQVRQWRESAWQRPAAGTAAELARPAEDQRKEVIQVSVGTLAAIVAAVVAVAWMMFR